MTTFADEGAERHDRPDFDLVAGSRKPLRELARPPIGDVLTTIQTRGPRPRSP